MLEQVRKIYFPENDCNVVTGLVPATGQFAAHLENGDLLRGYGHSRWAAIADLNEKLGAVDDEEPFDHEAARADHIVSLRREA